MSSISPSPRAAPSVTATPIESNQARITGLDVARALAVMGMVLVNFTIVMGADGGEPGWLNSITSAFDGRAAATFVTLAGIGASLGSRRARLGSDPAARRSSRVVLLKRAAILFAIGWAFFIVWPADILHFYGAYLAIGATLLFVRDRWLWVLATVAVSASAAWIMFFDFFENWNLTTLSYNNLATPAGFLRNLFLDGFHPVLPWIGFYLIGMWLGRTDLRAVVWRRTLVIWSAVVLVLTEATAWIALGPKGSNLDGIDDSSWRRLFSVDPLPPLPLYVLAGGATAILVICGSIWLAETLPRRVMEPLVNTGQLALTIYIAHVVIGMGLLDAVGMLDDQSLPWAVTTSTAFSATAVLASWLWRRRFRRGPVEAIMRRIAG